MLEQHSTHSCLALTDTVVTTALDRVQVGADTKSAIDLQSPVVNAIGNDNFDII